MEKKPYDKKEMHSKPDILTFKFGKYKAIENNHFEIRRYERTQGKTTDIFGEKKLTDKQTILKCFEILERDKYDFLVAETVKHKPKLVEFVIGFQTDEIGKRGEPIYIFTVVCINPCKETGMNEIAFGEEFFACITVVKETCKKKQKERKDNVVEHYLSYNKIFNKNIWTDTIKFCE